MKLKKHNYHITVKWKIQGIEVSSTFILSAVPLTSVEQAYKIAKILYPNSYGLIVESIKLNE